VTILTVLGLWVKEGQKSGDYTKLNEGELSKPKSYRSFTLLEVFSLYFFSFITLFQVESNKNPYLNANFISKLLFLWPSSLVSLVLLATLFSLLLLTKVRDTREHSIFQTCGIYHQKTLLNTAVLS
jgi:hypothetical protein